MEEISNITDLREKGIGKDGERIFLDKRLFVNLLSYGNCSSIKIVINELERKSIPGILYLDLCDPLGFALLTMSESPDFFVNDLREALSGDIFNTLTFKPEYSMFGRTYTLGYEREAEDWLIDRPKRVASDPDWPWAVWYPLRRKGEFSRLSHKEQMEILGEHGIIGRAFGKAGLGRDIRLSCAGLNKNDNDFILGLIGKQLHPLSALVEAMRGTKQTSGFIEKMGPFFIGKTAWISGDFFGEFDEKTRDNI